MPYEIEWLEAAIDELGAILRSHQHLRALLVDDSNRIDEILSADPVSFGTRQPDRLLATQVGRLRVLYQVDEETRQVSIASIELSI